MYEGESENQVPDSQLEDYGAEDDHPDVDHENAGDPYYDENYYAEAAAKNQFRNNSFKDTNNSAIPAAAKQRAYSSLSWAMNFGWNGQINKIMPVGMALPAKNL